MSHSWKSYTFNVRSLDQIDTQAIEAELDHKNPLFIMEVEGVEGVRVFLHDSIWTKAACSGRIKRSHNDPGMMWLGEMTENHRKLIDLFDEEDEQKMVPKATAKKIIALVKRIKKSNWINPSRAKVTVRKVEV